jgi:hypothetical protein
MESGGQLLLAKARDEVVFGDMVVDVLTLIIARQSAALGGE